MIPTHSTQQKLWLKNVKDVSSNIWNQQCCSMRIWAVFASDANLKWANKCSSGLSAFIGKGVRFFSIRTTKVQLDICPSNRPDPTEIYISHTFIHNYTYWHPKKKQHLPSTESTITTSSTSSPTAHHASIWTKSWGGSDLVATGALSSAIGPTYTTKWEATETTLLVVLSRVVISPWRQFEAILNRILLFSTCIAGWRMAEKKHAHPFAEAGSNGVKPRLAMSASSVKLSWSMSSMSLSALELQLLELSSTWRLIFQ